MLHLTKTFLCGLFSTALSLALCQSSESLSVNGIGDSTATITASDLSKLPQHTIKTTDHGKPVTFEGVRLADVLSKVTLPVGDAFHSTAASHFLVAEGRDGYRAVFAWAELDPTLMDKELYIITKRDGSPLPQTDGPFQLVAPGEKRGGRWVRQLKALRLSAPSPTVR